MPSGSPPTTRKSLSAVQPHRQANHQRRTGPQLRKFDRTAASRDFGQNEETALYGAVRASKWISGLRPISPHLCPGPTSPPRQWTEEFDSATFQVPPIRVDELHAVKLAEAFPRRTLVTSWRYRFGVGWAAHGRTRLCTTTRSSCPL